MSGARPGRKTEGKASRVVASAQYLAWVGLRRLVSPRKSRPKRAAVRACPPVPDVRRRAGEHHQRRRQVNRRLSPFNRPAQRGIVTRNPVQFGFGPCNGHRHGARRDRTSEHARRRSSSAGRPRRAPETDMNSGGATQLSTATLRALLNLNLNLNRAYPRTPLSVHPFRCGLPFPAKAFLASLAKGNQTGAFQWMTRCHAVFRARSSLAANYSTYILERREISGWNGTIPAEDPA